MLNITAVRWQLVGCVDSGSGTHPADHAIGGGSSVAAGRVYPLASAASFGNGTSILCDALFMLLLGAGAGCDPHWYQQSRPNATAAGFAVGGEPAAMRIQHEYNPKMSTS